MDYLDIIWLPIYSVIELSVYGYIWLPTYSVIELLVYRYMRIPNYSVIELLVYRYIQIPNYSGTRLSGFFGYRITGITVIFGLALTYISQ